MNRSLVLRRRSILTSTLPCSHRSTALLWIIVGLACSVAPVQAGYSTTGRWIGPFSMDRLPSGTEQPVRATHATVLRRQAAAGDSTLVVHWHEANLARERNGSEGAVQRSR